MTPPVTWWKCRQQAIPRSSASGTPARRRAARAARPARFTADWLSLANGDYKWHVLDYGAYGYGLNSAFKDLHVERSLLHAGDERQPGREWGGECPNARTVRAATRPERWCS